MNNLIAVYSKFILIFLILCYSIFTLTYLRTKSHAARSRVAGCQRFFLFVLHLLGYLVLFVQTMRPVMLFLYVIEAAFLAVYLVLWRVIYPRSSALVSNNICMLLAISFIIQARLDADDYLRQFVIIAAAGVASLILPALMRTFRNLTERFRWLVGGVGTLALAAVLVLGGTEYGAKLSLASIGIPLQPAEFVKILMCFFTAGMLAKDTSRKQVIKTTAVVAVNVGILVLCRDLGSALIYFLSYLLILYIASQKAHYSLAGFGAGALASVAAYRIFSHVRVRVQVWRDPWQDPSGTGYQILQGLFAIGTAGWFGMGLFQGAAGTIPLAHSDFVFAAIAEELGGVFALCLILICFENTIQILWLSSTLRNNFDKILVSGIGIFYGVQVFINVGGVLKMIPSTGVTLPFVSTGGSSVLASFLAFAVIQACFIRSEEREELERARAEALPDEVTGFRREHSNIGKIRTEAPPATRSERRAWNTAQGIDYDVFTFRRSGPEPGYDYEAYQEYGEDEEYEEYEEYGEPEYEDGPEEEYGGAAYEDEPAEAPEPVFTFRRRGVRYEDDEPDEVPGGPDDVFGEAPDDVFYEDDGEAADESGFVYHDDVRFDDD
ncbi:MAG: FtsW/RodA/SpoVE family cell cycle protein [Lachnospiraceae bacterium]|nr:FtsW/RodA/SpoVE family cell cycle protein [Lachnospiraceae bacterium]